MKKVISILLLLTFACTMFTSCSRFGSQRYVLDVLDAMDKGDDERFYKILSDTSYNINRNPNILIETFMSWVSITPTHTSPIEKACYLSRYDYVEALIKRGADVNRGYHLGALHASVTFLNTDIVRLLLENGADPSIGSTYPLISAVSEPWNYDKAELYEIIELLIEYGADKSFRAKRYGNRNAYEIALDNDAPQKFLDLLRPEQEEEEEDRHRPENDPAHSFSTCARKFPRYSHIAMMI